MKYEKAQSYIGTFVSLPATPDDVREALTEVEKAREQYYGSEAAQRPIHVYTEDKSLMVEFATSTSLTGRS